MQFKELLKEKNIVDKVWLKSYSPSVPHEINPDIYHSIVEIFQQTCQRFSHQPAFYNEGTTLSFAELDSFSHHFAAFLQNTWQLSKGSRIAIMLPNILQYPIVLFAALKAGLIIVNVNPLYTKDELIHQLNNSSAEAIIVLANFAATVEQALPNVPMLKHIMVTEVGDMLSFFKRNLYNFALKYCLKKVPAWNLPSAVSFKSSLKKGKKQIFHPVKIINSDVAFLQYTGGTTGISKGAILTHRNIIANMLQANAWFKELLHEKEIIITSLPLYHIFSLLANCLFFSMNGGLNVLITNPRNVNSIIKEMKKFPFTAITGVNTLFNALLKNSEFKNLDFSHLHLALGGGMAVQQVVAEKWQMITHAPLLEAYGLTETSPCVTINPAYLKSYNGTIGLPVPSTDICILDNEYHELPIGQRGELAIKGPQVMEGYWQNALETKKVFTQDGWLLTGDVASIDENGFVRILERKKDMILVSGFNVYPNEIEDVIAKMPGVKEVAVIGVNDDNSGETVKAFVVKESSSITAADVIKHCRQHLTLYKIPKYVDFVEELPKTNVGKILRRALKDHKIQ